VLFFSYIALERAYRARSHHNVRETKDAKGFDTSSLELKQLQKDIDRANDVGDGAFQLFQKLNERQMAIEDDIRKVLAGIGALQEAARSIDDQPRGSANIPDFQNSIESIKKIEDQTQRFANILLGPQHKGALGEKILKQQLAQLPHEWIDLNPPYPGGQKVEYALRVPDSRIIPIDSKWTGTEQMDRLGQTTDTEEQNKLKERIAMGVVRRSLEVRKYLDKERT
jgi:DNA anti-recombination protein RmuC